MPTDSPDSALPAGPEDELATLTDTVDEWWRTAVIYQIYPRSFADANGDGIGDLPGITRRLDALPELGVDAVWLSPFYVSPQLDAGYDVADYTDVDPLFGDLDAFDALLARAHDLGLKVVIDIVPNHCSSAHPWFQAALAAPAGSPERSRFHFRPGRGESGELPPNNWESVFGGPAWTRVAEPDGSPGEWYLHLFDSSQPDFDWTNPEVHELFRGILRFWLDRGVDGFRVDVAHGLVKAAGLPDWTPPEGSGSMGSGTFDPEASADVHAGAHGEPPADEAPYWAQDGVHEIWREWRAVLEEYGPERVLIGEAWVEPVERLAEWVRPDEMHQTFNFAYLETKWDARALRAVIAESLEAFSAVGAPSTWVLSNHDVIRHPSRLALTADIPQGDGLGPRSPGGPDPLVALARGRAATTLMLALPGSAYLYQGEELGLLEVVDLPDEARQDPTWFRTHGERYGRDGCRVPIPWEPEAPAFGFSPTGRSWLPQPDEWVDVARSVQRGVPGSTLELYRTLLALRAEHRLGAGTLEWLDGFGAHVVAFRNGPVRVVANMGHVPVELPEGTVLVSSMDLDGSTLPPDTTAWMRA